MKVKRRNFVKLAGLAGIGIFTNPKVMNLKNAKIENIENSSKKHQQIFNMAGYAAPKIDRVRIGIIGLGNRGPHHMRTMIRIEGVEVRALCDLLPERAEAAKKIL
jgi:predicted homoserine dehydrogenase-like protein